MARVPVKAPGRGAVQFEVVHCREIRLQIHGECRYLRFELLRDISSRKSYYARIWEFEDYNLTPTFPQDQSGKSIRLVGDTLLSERTPLIVGKRLDGFEAKNKAMAIGFVMKVLEEEFAKWRADRSKQ